MTTIGMTESCAMCAILPPDFHQYGTVGVPVPSCEIKLVDVPEANYFASNNPPQGEVLIRGPSVTKGYCASFPHVFLFVHVADAVLAIDNRPDITAETITADGWLKTGDVGQWNPDGTLSVIDRKKNLVKLAGGECKSSLVRCAFGLELTRFGTRRHRSRASRVGLQELRLRLQHLPPRRFEREQGHGGEYSYFGACGRRR